MITDKISLKSMTLEQLWVRRQELIDAFPPFDRLMRGSLITRHIKCGKSNCRCASGEGHPSLYLSGARTGKTKLDYVPASWKSWVLERIENYQLAQELLKELADINLELLRSREKD